MSRVNDIQLQMLIDYMEKHSLFARGQITSLGCQGREKYKSMWEILSNKLNSAGNAKKTPNLWEAYWKNLKISAKKKKSEYLHSMKKTGNDEIVELSHVHERISNIFGYYGTGLSIIPEVGVNNVKSFHRDNSTILKSANCHSNRNYNDISQIEAIITLILDLEMLQKQRQQQFVSFIHQFIATIRNFSRAMFEKDIIQRNRSNKSQISLLLSFMERNNSFARDVDRQEEIIIQQWEELADHLNSIGQRRSIEAWQRTWDDLVRLARDANDDIDIGIRTTELNPQEKQILRIMGILEYNLKRNRNTSTQNMPFGPSTSYNSSSKKRNIDLTTDDDDVFTKSFKTGGSPSVKKEDLMKAPVNFVQESNNIIAELSRNLIACFKEQNVLLKKGFEKISESLEKLSNDITMSFVQARVANDVQASIATEENQEDNYDPQNNQEEDYGQYTEYLDPEYET